MDEEKRQFKYGQFGYGKYIYPKDQMAEVGDFFRKALTEHFPEAVIDYLV